MVAVVLGADQSINGQPGVGILDGFENSSADVA